MRTKEIIDTQYGKKIALESSYDEKDAIKSLSWDRTHRSWNGDQWTVDATPYVLKQLEDIGCDITEDVADEIVEEENRKEELIELSQAHDVDTDFDAPSDKEYYSFQKAGIKYVLDRFENGKGALIADEMGLGKTIQTVGVINNKPSIESAIMVVPSSLKQNWKNELNEWLTRDLSVGIFDGDGIPDKDIVIFTYGYFSNRPDTLPEQVNLRDNDLLVLDESHYIKNHESNRTEAIMDLEADHRLYLTGTPIKNRPNELWTQISSLDEKTWEDQWGFWPFMKHFCNAHRTEWGWDMDGASNLDELQKELRASIMVRREKSEVLDDLPDKIRQVISLPRNGLNDVVSEQENKLEEYVDEMQKLEKQVDEIDQDEANEKYKEKVKELRSFKSQLFEMLSELRHEIALEKVPQIVEHVEDVLESEDKVVVFAHHRDVVAELENHFGDEAVSIKGGTNDRETPVKRFQNDDDVNVFIGSIQAAGEGITLTEASTVVIGETPWTPSAIKQAEDRLHRIGQDEPVHVQHLVVDESIEAWIAQKNVQKQEVIEQTMSDDISSQQDGLDEISIVDEIVAQIEDDTDNADSVKNKKEIHEAVKHLASLDPDRATEENDMGFNKMDSEFGHSLARQDSLTDKQARSAKDMLKKYHRQIPDDLYVTIFE